MYFEGSTYTRWNELDLTITGSGCISTDQDGSWSTVLQGRARKFDYFSFS